MTAAPTVPLDADLARIVAALRAQNAPPPFAGSASEARQRMTRAILAARERHGLPEVGTVRDLDGAPVPGRLYRPATAGPHATVVFFHGGGFVLGSVELMDDIARKLCRDLDAAVVSVDYRLAPEHPYPAAHDDALAATRWVQAHARELGGDPARVAVAGESAGANLAASAALLCCDAGQPLAAQLLVVPGLDMARDTQRLDADGRDYPMLSPADLRDIARLYMAERAGEAAAFPPSPLRATDLGRLPPAVISVAGHDPLQGEGLAYADRLRRAGGPVTLLRHDDMFHPFLGFFEASAAARRANDELCRAFRACLASLPQAGAKSPGHVAPQEDPR